MALEVEAGSVEVVEVTGLELEMTEVVEPRLLELLLMAEFTAPETKGWICSTTVEMRSSWEKEEDCCPAEREEDPEKELETKLEEDPDEKDPELDEIPAEDDTEELPEFEELKLDAGLSLIWTKFSWTFLVSVYPMGPAS